MQILKATIIKDLKILLRDRVGLFMMFFMPILLVIVITSVQNSTFELVNNNKISLLVYNKDKGPLGRELVDGIKKIGLFKLQVADSSENNTDISIRMHEKNALVAFVIPTGFTTLYTEQGGRNCFPGIEGSGFCTNEYLHISRTAGFPDHVLSSGDAGFFPRSPLKVPFAVPYR